MKKVAFLLFLSLFFISCSSSIFTGYEYENKQKHIKIIEQDCQIEEPKNDLVYNANYSAYLAYLCGDYENSIKYFDIVEQKYKENDEKNLLSNTANLTSSILVNDNINDYEGKFLERPFANSYKALDYLALNDFAAARVEVNRALDRQRIIKDEFSKDIYKKINEYKKEHAKLKNLLKRNLNYEYLAYKDFANPFISYLAALFYVLDKDYANARYFFNEVYVWLNDELFLEDVKIAESSFRKNKYVWLIFDNGFSKTLEELDLSIPLAYFNGNYNDFNSINFNIAVLGDSFSAYEYLYLNQNKTHMLSNMDDVLIAEYEATFNKRLSKSLSNAIAKVYSTSAANQQNELLGLSLGVFNILSNRSDLRYFVGLPKNYQVSRVENTGVVKIQDSMQKVILNTQLDDKYNYLIYIKAPVKGVFYTKIFKERI